MRAEAGEGSAIIIVGDDALARSAVRGLVEREETLAVLGDGRPAELDELMGLLPDVVVWDAGPAARTSAPPNDVSVPLLALVEQPGEAARLFREHINVLQRAADADTLSAAVLAVSRGLRVLDGAFSEAAPRTLPDALVEPLTPRELEVLALLADGLSNRRVAKRLDISEHTVKFHVNAILLKLDADTRTAAVVKAARLGLLHL